MRLNIVMDIIIKGLENCDVCNNEWISLLLVRTWKNAQKRRIFGSILALCNGAPAWMR